MRRWIGVLLAAGVTAGAIALPSLATHVQTLSVVVRSLDRLEQIVPAVQALGRRHAGYGVRASHYDTVGQALLWTLGQGLGDGFTLELRDAWTEAYTVLATVMIEASEVHEAAA